MKGEVVGPFSGPLRDAIVASAGTESILLIDIIDQSHLQGVLSSLADRGIEIVAFGTGG